MGNVGVDGIHLQAVSHAYAALKKFSSGKEKTNGDSNNDDDKDSLQIHNGWF